MTDWRNEPLSAVCEFINRGVSPKYLDRGGIAVLNQKCVRDHEVNYAHGRRHDFAAKKVAPERLLRAGDVLVNSTGTGTLGRVAQLREAPTEPTTVDSHVTIVRPIPSLFHPEFFGYAMIAIEEQIQAGGEGCGGQTELSRSKLAEEYRVGFPTDLGDQHRIVTLLDEAFADIATAKANAEKNLQNADDLFASALASIFSAKDATWEEKTIGQWVSSGLLAKPQDGNHGEIHPTKADYVETGVPFIMAADLMNGQVDTENCRFISKVQSDNLRIGFAKSGDVLLSHKGTIGRVAILSTDLDYVMLTPQVTYYRSLDLSRLSAEFLYICLLSPQFQSAMNDIAGAGSTRAYIGITRQMDLKLAAPPLGKQIELAKKLRAIEFEREKVSAKYRQKLTALADLKKSLLHQAFSGRL